MIITLIHNLHIDRTRYVAHLKGEGRGCSVMWGGGGRGLDQLYVTHTSNYKSSQIYISIKVIFIYSYKKYFHSC